MEEFKKIIKPNLKINNVVQPIKTVTIPTYNDLAKATLSKDKYLSEFSTEKDKRRVRENLGIGNNFKVVGEYDTLELLQQNVPVGNENEAYLVGSEIYTWSDALKKWFRYGAAGSSADDLAHAAGYRDWVDQFSRTHTKIIYGLENIEALELFNVIDRLQENNYLYYNFFGEFRGEYFPLDISKISTGYTITFTTPDAWHTITVTKVGNDYFGNWQCMQISN